MMRPPYAEHYYPADPPYESGTCWGCGKVKPALAWRDTRAPDARLCGRCVPPDVAIRHILSRPAQPPQTELDGQTAIEIPGLD